jgi:hypothetical protein
MNDCPKNTIPQETTDRALAVATNGRKIGLAIAKLPGVEVLQEADDGFNIAFPKVAAIIKPRRRRKLTEKERERLAKQGFKPAVNRTSHAPAASGVA